MYVNLTLKKRLYTSKQPDSIHLRAKRRAEHKQVVFRCVCHVYTRRRGIIPQSFRLWFGCFGSFQVQTFKGTIRWSLRRWKHRRFSLEFSWVSILRSPIVGPTWGLQGILEQSDDNVKGVQLRYPLENSRVRRKFILPDVPRV